MNHSLILNYIKQSQMRRLSRLEKGSICLHRLNIYILPSRQGLFFALIITLMLIGSINYHNSLGFMFTFLLGSLAVIDILHTYRNIWRLRFSPAHSPPVFCGQTMTVPLKLENYGKPTREELCFQFADDSEQQIFDIEESQFQTIQLQRQTTKRGLQPLGRIIVSTTYPMGLFRAWAVLNFDHKILVYPRPAESDRLPAESNSNHKTTGSLGQGSDDFVGLRNYHPGDSMRHIFWKAYAKNHTLLTKQFGGEQQQQLWLDWQLLSGLDVESRLSQLTRWVIEAHHSDVSYGLRLPDTVISPSTGDSHQHQCLRALARFGLND
ncbi:MAG: DUF58 domain-containing protein [Gammaproteobacteria bacterium]|nr:DUF58 domain-containing protein [Gammaproteobacteria bacterium]